MVEQSAHNGQVAGSFPAGPTIFNGDIMTARNDITGDAIANTKGDQKKYAENWDRIFGNKDKDKESTEQKKEKK